MSCASRVGFMRCHVAVTYWYCIVVICKSTLFLQIVQRQIRDWAGSFLRLLKPIWIRFHRVRLSEAKVLHFLFRWNMQYAILIYRTDCTDDIEMSILWSMHQPQDLPILLICRAKSQGNDFLLRTTAAQQKLCRLNDSVQLQGFICSGCLCSYGENSRLENWLCLFSSNHNIQEELKNGTSNLPPVVSATERAWAWLTVAFRGEFQSAYAQLQLD